MKDNKFILFNLLKSILGTQWFTSNFYRERENVQLVHKEKFQFLELYKVFFISFYQINIMNINYFSF